MLGKELESAALMEELEAVRLAPVVVDAVSKSEALVSVIYVVSLAPHPPPRHHCSRRAREGAGRLRSAQRDLGRSGVAGRFLSEARQKRRAGSGILADNDRWMLESISKPGGINVLKLRWAKMESELPESAAHLSIAFDTFESHVIANPEEPATRPYFAYGLLSYFERSYFVLKMCV